MPCRIDTEIPPSARATVPLPDALAWVEGEIEALKAEGLERPLRVRSGRQGAAVTLDGRDLIN
ncbi:MAG: hypothetical protein ACK52C_02930, partial [Planctomycetia bacterium]